MDTHREEHARWRIHLSLGRVSNLPTVWTNTLSAAVLCGAAWQPPSGFCLLLGLTLFYIAGMYLNDALDASIDVIERPERPIPAGLISRRQVLLWSLGLMVTGLLCVALARAHVTGGWPGSWTIAESAVGQGDSLAWLIAALALVAAIVLYDAHHKNNPLSPLLMGLCRVLLLVTVSCTLVAAVPFSVILAALLLFGYLVGLTHAARFESTATAFRHWPLGCLLLPPLAALTQVPAQPPVILPVVLLCATIARALSWIRRRQPGDMPKAIGLLIAGISLVDATLLMAAGHTGWGLLALLGMPATLALQSRISGT